MGSIDKIADILMEKKPDQPCGVCSRKIGEHTLPELHEHLKKFMGPGVKRDPTVFRGYSEVDDPTRPSESVNE